MNENNSQTTPNLRIYLGRPCDPLPDVPTAIFFNPFEGIDSFLYEATIDLLDVLDEHGFPDKTEDLSVLAPIEFEN